MPKTKGVAVQDGPKNESNQLAVMANAITALASAVKGLEEKIDTLAKNQVTDVQKIQLNTTTGLSTTTGQQPILDNLPHEPTAPFLFLAQ